MTTPTFFVPEVAHKGNPVQLAEPDGRLMWRPVNSSDYTLTLMVTVPTNWLGVSPFRRKGERLPHGVTLRKNLNSTGAGNRYRQGISLGEEWMPEFPGNTLLTVGLSDGHLVLHQVAMVGQDDRTDPRTPAGEVELYATSGILSRQPLFQDPSGQVVAPGLVWTELLEALVSANLVDAAGLPPVDDYVTPSDPDLAMLEPGQGLVVHYNPGHGRAIVKMADGATATAHWSQLPVTPGKLRQLQMGDVVTGALDEIQLPDNAELRPDRVRYMLTGVSVLQPASV